MAETRRHAVAQALVPGGRVRLGDSVGDGYPADGERPVREVMVGSFSMDTTTVTAAMFSAFVTVTGYVSTAEHQGTSHVFVHQVQARRKDLVGAAPEAPWWLEVRGASWRHPAGRDSSWEESADHPVVHVSYDDALAYSRWAGRRLPSEEEWESAARGGLVDARFPWGDDLLGPDGEHRCNIWQGRFPDHNTGEDGWLGTAPAAAYPPNGLGLHQMVGNVWEWSSSRWTPPASQSRDASCGTCGPTALDTRVTRGGSFLCHASYCYRYRVSARNGTPVHSTSSNLGFRTVRTG